MSWYTKDMFVNIGFVIFVFATAIVVSCSSSATPRNLPVDAGPGWKRVNRFDSVDLYHHQASHTCLAERPNGGLALLPDGACH